MREEKIRKRIAVLVSDEDTMLKAIIDAIESKKVNLEIALIAANKHVSPAVEIAAKSNIPYFIIGSKVDESLSALLKILKVDLIVLADYKQAVGLSLKNNHTIVDAKVEFNCGKSYSIVYYDDNIHGDNIIIRTDVRSIYSDEEVEITSETISEKRIEQLIRVLKDFANGEITL